MNQKKQTHLWILLVMFKKIYMIYVSTSGCKTDTLTTKNPSEGILSLLISCINSDAVFINIPLKHLNTLYLVHSKEQEVLSIWTHQVYSSQRQAVKKERMSIKREQYAEYKFSHSHVMRSESKNKFKAQSTF